MTPGEDGPSPGPTRRISRSDAPDGAGSPVPVASDVARSSWISAGSCYTIQTVFENNKKKYIFGRVKLSVIRAARRHGSTTSKPARSGDRVDVSSSVEPVPRRQNCLRTEPSWRSVGVPVATSWSSQRVFPVALASVSTASGVSNRTDVTDEPRSSWSNNSNTDNTRKEFIFSAFAAATNWRDLPWSRLRAGTRGVASELGSGGVGRPATETRVRTPTTGRPRHYRRGF